MASTTVINANATGKPQISSAAPIQPLRNETARLYTHLHPVLVLSIYALKFPALVADPVPTLLSTLLPLAVLQIAYVAVCLPPTGGTPMLRKQKPGEKKGRVAGQLEQGLNSKIVVSPYRQLQGRTMCIIGPKLITMCSRLSSPFSLQHSLQHLYLLRRSSCSARP